MASDDINQGDSDSTFSFAVRELHPLMPIRSEGLDYDQSAAVQGLSES